MLGILTGRPATTGFHLALKSICCCLRTLAKVPSATHGLQLSDARCEAMQVVLRSLVDSGILVSTVDLDTHRSRSAGVSAPQKRITSIIVPTRNRPHHVERAVQSAAANSLAHGHSIRIIVGDDSDPDHALATDQMLANTRTRLPLQIDYIGVTERNNFVANIIELSDAPPDLVRYALTFQEGTDTSIGANLNHLLLSTVGEFVLIADDDVIIDSATTTPGDRKAVFSSRHPLRELQFYGTRARLLEEVGIERIDVVGIHQELLGKSTARVASDWKGCTEEDTNVSLRLRNLIDSGSGNITVTMPGIFGDCAFGANSQILCSPPATLVRMNADEERYQQARRSRELSAWFNHYFVSDSFLCMGYNLGVDNTITVPPWLPSGRNCGAIFALTLRAAYPEVLHGYFAGLHLSRPANKAILPGWSNSQSRLQTEHGCGPLLISAVAG